MAEDRDPDTERTTIVTTDGDGRGSAGIILIVALIAILLAVLFFGGLFDRDDERDVNLDIAPDVNLTLPDTQLPPPPPVIVVPEGQAPPPDVNVNITTPPPEPAENLSDADTVEANSG